MGIYSRFKRAQDGFRALVELLESTPITRRQKMIDAGMAEDPAYTEQALKYVLSFEDVIQLPDLELAEVVAAAPPRIMAYAISQTSDEVKNRFLSNAQPRVRAEIKDYLSVQVGLRELGGAQLKIVEVTRQLERRGLIKTKRIPLQLD